jgi:uncharacterized protein (DUF1778 family)
MQYMPRRKSGDVTIRLAWQERRALEEAAARQHLPVSTWLRQAALRAAAREALADEGERRRRVARALEVLGTVPREDADRLREDVRRGRREWGRDRR